MSEKGLHVKSEQYPLINLVRPTDFVLYATRVKVSDAGIVDIKYSALGDLILIASVDCSIFIYKIEENKFIYQTNLPSKINSAIFVSGMDSKIVVACQNGVVYTIDVLKNTIEPAFTHPNNSSATYITGSPHFLYIVGFQDGSIGIRSNLKTKTHFLRSYSYAITSIAIEEGETHFAASSVDGIVRYYNLLQPNVTNSKYQCVNSSFVCVQPISHIAFMPASSQLLVASLDEFIRVFKMPFFDGAVISQMFQTGSMLSHFDYVKHLPITSKGPQFIFIQGQQGSIYLLDILFGDILSKFDIFDHSGVAICCNPKCLQIAAGGGPGDGTLAIITLPDEALAKRMENAKTLVLRAYNSASTIGKQLLVQQYTQRANELVYPLYNAQTEVEQPTAKPNIPTPYITEAAHIKQKISHSIEQINQNTQEKQPNDQSENENSNTETLSVPVTAEKTSSTPDKKPRKEKDKGQAPKAEDEEHIPEPKIIGVIKPKKRGRPPKPKNNN